MHLSGKPPVIYELNTWVWLQRLSSKYGRRLDLSSVPAMEWDTLGSLDCDAVWLMGVWQRSPAGRQIALHDPGVMAACRRALPDLTDDDIPGSPYCVQGYVVDSRLGSLGEARSELLSRGLRLILDFVPNHVARDNAWTAAHPEYFIQGTPDDLKRAPDSYFECAGHIIACGRDPHFPAWTDTAQLNAFSPNLRIAMIDTLLSISSQCDGVRCDMAMLELSDVFASTWGDAAGEVPKTQYWSNLISNIRRTRPDFLFLAEAYWNREWDLQQLGLDYCYDKRLYDRLVHDPASSIRDHLSADIAYQEKLVRFLENHDEARAAATISEDREKAAAIAIATLPGSILYFQGQFCGAKIHIPVQLGRGPVERCDAALDEFYGRVRDLTLQIKTKDAIWKLCQSQGWPDNTTANNLLAWCWETPKHRFLIVINFSEQPSQAHVNVPWRNLAGFSWKLEDLWANQTYVRGGTEMQNQGIYVALDPWNAHIFRLT